MTEWVESSSGNANIHYLDIGTDIRPLSQVDEAYGSVSGRTSDMMGLNDRFVVASGNITREPQ